MSKKSIQEREKKRQFLFNKYFTKRSTLLATLKKVSSMNESFILHKKIQKLPKNSIKIRLKNRCWKTGRPSGYFRFFGLSRNLIREMGHQALFPGFIKSSW